MFRKPVQTLADPLSERGTLVVQAEGLVERLAEDGSERAAFVDLRPEVHHGVQWGLMALALAPKFPRDPRAFVAYVARDPLGRMPIRSVLAQLKSTDGGKSLDPKSLRTLIEQRQRIGFHPIADVKFGPRDLLYVAWGAADTTAQDLGDLFGKVLRIDVSDERAYTVPSDNPFVNRGKARPEIYAYGFRNPWRMSFDLASGDLWLGDVGETSWEEINRVTRGGNYGWKLAEGHACFRSETCDLREFEAPRVVHSHSEASAVIGGLVYRGTRLPQLVDKYVYATWEGTLWALNIRTSGQRPEPILSTQVPIASLTEDASHELLITSAAESTQAPSKIYRLVSGPLPQSSARVALPSKLSATGCVDIDPRRGHDAGKDVVAYEINVPAWSDGATAERTISSPSVIDELNGQYIFPPGTVLTKTMSKGGRRVETQLLILHATREWRGYSYEWNAAQSEAHLLAAGKERRLEDGTLWHFPSREECLQCHNASGRVLSFHPAQLNREIIRAGRRRNQVEIFESRHLTQVSRFMPEYARKGISDLPRLTETSSASAATAARAEAYLHANCSHCHRPGGAAGHVGMDLRVGTPMARRGICLVPTTAGIANGVTAILVPGQKRKSTLWHRMQSLGTDKMPPTRQALDGQGGKLIADWIDSLTSCPDEEVAHPSMMTSRRAPPTWEYAVPLEGSGHAVLSGFFDPEFGEEGQWRWTGGSATIKLTDLKFAAFEDCALKVVTGRPQRFTVVLGAGGLTRLASTGTDTEQSFVLPQALRVGTTQLSIGIRSETFVPGRGDSRELGVMIREIAITCR